METRIGGKQEYFFQKRLNFNDEPTVLDTRLRTFLRKGGCGIWTSTVICRKEAVERVGRFDRGMRIYEDVRLWARSAFEGKRAVSS